MTNPQIRALHFKKLIHRSNVNLVVQTLIVYNEAPGGIWLGSDRKIASWLKEALG